MALYKNYVTLLSSIQYKLRYSFTEIHSFIRSLVRSWPFEIVRKKEWKEGRMYSYSLMHSHHVSHIWSLSVSKAYSVSPSLLSSSSFSSSWTFQAKPPSPLREINVSGNLKGYIEGRVCVYKYMCTKQAYAWLCLTLGA